MKRVTPEEITQTRQVAGLSQTEAAKLACVSLRTWQHYEQGKTRINLRLWERVVQLIFSRANQ